MKNGPVNQDGIHRKNGEIRPMRLIPAILFAFILLSGCPNPNRKMIEEAPYLTMRFRDDAGRDLKMKEHPKRIISLAPSLTEMIFACGGGDKLVARSQSSDYPPEATYLPEVVSFPSPDFEAMIDLEADLVFGTDEILPARLIPSFDKLNLPVFLQHYDSLADVIRNIRVTGQILGTDSIAKHLADSLEQKLNSIRQQTTGQIAYPCFVIVSAEPLIVAGGSSYVNDLLVKAGAKNIFGEMNEAYPKVTPEAILAANPEFIIVPDENGQLYADLMVRYPVLAKMPAAGTGQVFAVDPDLIFRPGPRIFEGLEILTRIFHPSIQAETNDAE